MEFLRFGSSIPGGYCGCCAFDIAQCFKQNPDDKASISVVNGDGGFPMMDGKGVLFLGPTWHDIFKQRLRINRSEEHTSELQSLMRISYAVFCLKKKTKTIHKKQKRNRSHHKKYTQFKKAMRTKKQQ